MERVTFSEFDSDNEKLKVVNRIIDNQNQIEGKLLQLIADSESKTKKKVVKKKVIKKKTKVKKKGMVRMKTLIVLVLSVLCIAAWAMVDTTEINYSNVTSGTFDQNLRRWFDTVNQDVVLATGLPSLLSGGTVYYVDGNKSSAGTGIGGWDNAFNTLSAALAASHANIAVSSRRAWATRNTIFVIGDFITEDLTKLAQKTDVIGLGSTNQYKKAGILGDHVIEAATTAHYMGCRLINMHFRGDGGGILFDIPINQNGIEFISCEFQQNGGETIGLRLGGNHDTKILGCVFRPNTSGLGFSTAAIQVLNGAGSVTNINIDNNQIESSGIGIDWNETSNINCWIDGNRFFTTGMVIDSEDVTELMVIKNRGISLLNSGDNTISDFNIKYAADNIFTGDNDTKNIPSIAD